MNQKPSCDDVTSDLLEIHDPDVDVDQLMVEIRRRIAQHREELGYPRTDFPSFGASACPQEPEHGDFDADLYYHLRKVNELYAAFDLAPELAPSTSTRIPLLGRIWGSIRREAHNLVLFYIGRLTRQEIALNRHLVSTLNRLTVLVQQQHELLKALTEQIMTNEGREV